MFRPSGLDRRSVLLAAAGLTIPGCSRGRPATASGSPLRCADFLKSIGVNTHLGYYDSQYADVMFVRKALDYVGVRLVRDAAMGATDRSIRPFNALAEDGVSFCAFWDAKRGMNDVISILGNFERAHPGAIHALEGPNEIRPNFAYQGMFGNVAGRQFMADLRQAASRSAQLRRTPLINLTSYANVATDCDFANVHPYPKAGAQPGPILKTVWDRNVGSYGIMPGKPIVFTEFGYHTLTGRPVRPGFWQGVTPDVQAALLVNALFVGARVGVSRIYIYQLLDAYHDSAPGKDQEKHFGLFRYDGSAKPAARVLNRLSTLLRDDGPSAATFATRGVGAQVSLSGAVSCVAIQHSSGQDFLALWNESPLWDPKRLAPIEIEPCLVGITIPQGLPIKAFDLLDPTQDRDFKTARSVSVSVGGAPVMVRLG